jgi:hypothetical protein
LVKKKMKRKKKAVDYNSYGGQSTDYLEDLGNDFIKRWEL